MNHSRTMLALPMFAALGLAAAPPVQAQTYTFNTLANFNGSGNGANPSGSLTLIGSTLYGTTEFGGSSGDGTVFSVPVGGGTPTTLVSFTGANGANPYAGLMLIGSTLYGTTFGDGVNNDGTVFSVPVGGGAPTVLAAFTGANGNGPTSGLTLSASGSTLYGTTQDGGVSGAGVVFSVPVAGGTPTTLVNFAGSNGETPNAGLTLSANGATLYGTTLYGGAGSDGTVFSVPVAGGVPTTLASFTGTTATPPSGANPYAGLTLVGTTLYGTTQDGGTNGEGTVFSVPVAGGTPTTLVSFTGANGSYPLAGLTAGANNTLFGTTQDGGASGANSVGTVFSFNTLTNTLTTLVTFNNTNGAFPLADLTFAPNGTLYGTTSGGGDANGDGTVFSLTPVAAPEPSSGATLSLIALGLGALLLRARRRAH